MPSFGLDPWDSIPVTFSFRQQCRQLLGNFFHFVENIDPWWVSIANAVDGIEETCLSHLLGFEYNVGIDLLCAIGLAKCAHSQNPLSTVVVVAEWEKFIEEEEFGDIMENINNTKVKKKGYYFLNYVKKQNLCHHPIDQFSNGSI